MKNQSEYAVHLQKDGVTESFLPGDEIPEWAAKRITNPLVLGEQSEESEIPARAGAGSSRDKWVAYAGSHGVTVEDGASRDDIVAACEAAGVPVG